MNVKGIILSVVLAVLFLIGLILSPFTVVGAGHRGVITNIGTVSDIVLSEGFHWVKPFDGVHDVDVRTQKIEATAAAASKDLQTVSATVAVNYRLIPELVNKLYQNVEGDYAATVIAPAIQDSVKAATAQYTAEELITKRAEVSSLIEANLATRLQAYSIVETVAIVNFDFSDSFNQAIEAKVTAEQNALASKNLLEQKKYEAEQTIVSAQAEAESIRIKGEALKENSSLVQLEWVNKWNGVLPSTVMGDGIMPLVNLK